MIQEKYDITQNNPNGKIFREIVKGVNFLTPVILDYKKCGKYIVEISKSRENPDIDAMYGVTVITKKENSYEENFKLCKAFYDYNEVEQYLKELEK